MTDQPALKAAVTRPDLLRLLGVEDVAGILGTSRHEVIELIESGQLPCVRVGVERAPRVSRVMLESWQDAIGRGEAIGAPEPPRRRRRGVRRL